MTQDDTRKFTVDEKLDMILSDMAAMKADMAAMKADMVEMKADIAGLKADVAEAKTEAKETADRTDARMTALETKVDERLHDTRPMWQAIHAQTERLIERQDRTEQRQERMEQRQERTEQWQERTEQRQEERHAETQKSLQQLFYQHEELAAEELRLKGTQRDLRKRVTALEESQQKAA